MKNETFTNRLEEIKKLNSLCVPSKGHMQGLTLKQYDRINSLHSYFVSTKEGLDALYANGILTK